VIRAGSALFVTIFFATPAPRHVFSLRQLKICLTPTLVATACEPFVHPKPNRDHLPSLPPLKPAGSAGQVLSDLLGSVLTSYETVVKTISDQSPGGMGKEERRLWRQRVEKFAEVLRGACAVMSQVTRAERKPTSMSGPKHCAALATRTETLIRTMEDILRTTHTSTGRTTRRILACRSATLPSV
jgi:hypothetical protein